MGFRRTSVLLREPKTGTGSCWLRRKKQGDAVAVFVKLSRKYEVKNAVNQAGQHQKTVHRHTTTAHHSHASTICTSLQEYDQKVDPEETPAPTQAEEITWSCMLMKR